MKLYAVLNHIKENAISHFALFILLVVLILAGFKTYSSSIIYENELTTFSESQNVTDLTKEKLKSKFSFKWFGTPDDNLTSSVNFTGPTAPIQSYKYIIILALIVLAILCSYFIVNLKTFNIYSSLMSVVLLLFGIFTPIMMVTIHKDITYIGDVILSFESKSMVSSILKLFEHGDYVIAVVILLFSVLMPLAKTTSLFLISVFEDTTFTHKLLGFFSMLGKWSMIDVFVVAVLLVFLSANKGDVSRAEVGMGLYIFLCYVVVSMLVSVTTSKMIKRIDSER